jgi:hypothetical protein
VLDIISLVRLLVLSTLDSVGKENFLMTILPGSLPVQGGEIGCDPIFFDAGLYVHDLSRDFPSKPEKG